MIKYPEQLLQWLITKAKTSLRDMNTTQMKHYQVMFLNLQFQKPKFNKTKCILKWIDKNQNLKRIIVLKGTVKNTVKMQKQTQKDQMKLNTYQAKK